ncbi:DUF2634 domain-containing protein [Leuconostocaceae bacterium ESL0958]|nr:DUF2634 domain-containing protein [Leuconostocaceae bacterium ESL0958]
MDQEKIEEVTLSTLTYEVKNGRIVSMIDRREAMRQAIEKALLTARFSVPWLSKNYGTDLFDLIGKSKDYAKTEIKRMIVETFISDKRVTDVEVTKVEDLSKDSLMAEVTVSTIFGDVTVNKEVTA